MLREIWFAGSKIGEEYDRKLVRLWKNLDWYVKVIPKSWVDIEKVV